MVANRTLCILVWVILEIKSLGATFLEVSEITMKIETESGKVINHQSYSMEEIGLMQDSD